MAERSLRRGWRGGGVAAALLALSACAASGRGPAPRPLDGVEAQAFATILRMEDQRARDMPALERLAASPSAAVRARAALALGRLGRAEAVPVLTALLSDADTAVIATAAFALGLVGDTAAVEPLRALLRVAQSAPTVAAEAADALGRLPSREAAAALEAFLAAAPPGAGGPVGSALLATWRHPSPASLDPLLRWTEASDPALRWRAAYALVRRADPRATRVLLGLADDPDARVRALAVRGLTAPLADSAGIGSAVTLPRLLAALEDPDYAVRVNAARALGSYRHPESVRALAGLLSSAEDHRRIAALESLGRLGPAASAAAAPVAALVESGDQHVFIRQTALETLASVAPSAALSLTERFLAAPEWRLRAAAARSLARLPGVAPRALRSSLDDRDPRVESAALQARIDAAGADLRPLLPLLLEKLGARDVMVRAAALGALARLAESASLPAVLDAYQVARGDSLNDAALAAVDALGALNKAGVRAGAAFFARFPRSPDGLVRLRAAAALGEAGPWGDPLPLEPSRSGSDYHRLAGRGAAADRVAVIETSRGIVRLRLFSADAPLTVDNFLSLAEQGYFDGQEWPRVVPNFVVQGGDPRGDTSGGPGYVIRDEINRHRYGTGSLGMALSGPDTGGSQFFVTHSPQPHLDGIYTVFGQVLGGQEVLERLLPGDRIVRIRQLR